MTESEKFQQVVQAVQAWTNFDQQRQEFARKNKGVTLDNASQAVYDRLTERAKRAILNYANREERQH